MTTELLEDYSIDDDTKVKCMLCDEEFSQITGTHLRFSHDISTNEYAEMFHFPEMVCKEQRRCISESLIGHNVSEETRRRTSDTLAETLRRRSNN